MAVSEGIAVSNLQVGACLRIMNYFSFLLGVSVLLISITRYISPQSYGFRIVNRILSCSKLVKRYRQSNVIESLAYYLSVNIGLCRAFQLMQQDKMLLASSELIEYCFQSSMSGKVLSDVLSIFKCCDEFALHRIELAERSSSLPNVLMDIAWQEKQYVFLMVSRYLKMLSPVLMILFAIVLMMLFSAIYQPLINL